MIFEQSGSTYYDLYRDNVKISGETLARLRLRLQQVGLDIPHSLIACTVTLHEYFHQCLRKYTIKIMRFRFDTDTVLTFLSAILEEVEHKVIHELLPEKVRQVERILYRLWYIQEFLEGKYTFFQFFKLCKQLVRLCMCISCGIVDLAEVRLFRRSRRFYKIVDMMHQVDIHTYRKVYETYNLLLEIVENVTRLVHEIVIDRKGKVSCGTSNHQSFPVRLITQ